MSGLEELSCEKLIALVAAQARLTEEFRAEAAELKRRGWTELAELFDAPVG